MNPNLKLIIVIVVTFLLAFSTSLLLEFPIFEELRNTEEFEKFRIESDVFKEMINIEEKE